MTESKRRKKKVDRSGLDQDVIHNLNTALANELSMVKTKLMKLESREKHMEVEMNEMRKLLVD